jgi:S-adenosylmethionine hydrolase
MKAIVLTGCPHAVLIDVSHDVPHFDISAGAFMLFAGTRHFPGGTVHIGVVDPDVGSTRRRLALKAGGRYYVGPDNGLFGIVIDEVGLEQVVELAARPEAAPTVEGRDVFAPAAAALASGVPLDSLGHRTDPPRMLDNSSPRILWVDGFGNLVTNLKPPVRPMRIHSHYITAAAKTYWDAKPNEPFVYVGSMGYLEIAVREQRADRMLGARSGMQIELI